MDGSMTIPAAHAMIREAFRAAGWEATMKAFAVFSTERAKISKPETVKAMHDEVQALCGELWKGIKP